MKIICCTQRSIQTLALIYLLGHKNIFFDHIFFLPIKNKLLKLRNEEKNSWKMLKHQCELLNIPFSYLTNINNKSFLNKINKIKPDCMISFVADTIISKKVISKFKKGIFSWHGGILPDYRGFNSTAWSILNGSKKVGISLQKITDGVDTGNIVYCKKININSGKTIFELDKKLYYSFKLNYFTKLIKNLKNKKKINFLIKKKEGKQYFSMHEKLIEIVNTKLKN